MVLNGYVLPYFLGMAWVYGTHIHHLCHMASERRDSIVQLCNVKLNENDCGVIGTPENGH